MILEDGADGADEADDDAGEDEARGTIPIARLNKVLARQRDLKAQLRQAEERLSGLEALTGERDAAKARADALEAQVGAAQEVAALARAGVIEDDHADALRLAWGKLPEKDRPALPEYAATVASMKPDERPRVLAGFYGAATTTGGSPPPKPPRSGASEPPAGGADALRADVTKARAAWSANPTPENAAHFFKLKKQLEDRG